jgi:N6-adenosine-specific RNA methylase IME4
MAGNNAKQKYTTILADPPWEWLQGTGSYGAGNHYRLMNFEEISKMPIADLAATNAHLYLWTTNGCLPYAFDILKAWGFEYRSIFTWVKPKLGLGNYMRNCTEQVLFATRGKAPVLFKAQPSWGFFPLQDHSHKPEEFHKVIERMSPGPYLELFARRRQPGWDVWGDDKSIQSDVDIPGYPVPNLRRGES